MEYLKCNVQISKEKRLYSEMYNEVGVRGVYKGLAATFVREVPGWGIYFWAYEYFKSLTFRDTDKTQQLSLY